MTRLSEVTIRITDQRGPGIPGEEGYQEEWPHHYEVGGGGVML